MNLRKLDGQYIVLDIEFLNEVKGTECIELAAKRIYSFNHGSEFEEGNSFRRLIKPQQTPSKLLLSLTGITQESLNNAKDFESVFKEFKRWMTSEGLTMNETLFIAWGNRDEAVLRKDCKTYGLLKDFEDMTFVDFQQYVMSQDSITKLPSLETIIEREFGEFKGTEHHARDDAYNTALLVQSRLERLN